VDIGVGVGWEERLAAIASCESETEKTKLIINIARITLVFNCCFCIVKFLSIPLVT
jgi:hypothetical protein